ncbi:MAG: hypothetical protein GY915_00010, partial [bacterium]|nr:hypothetical protein [bacterium]
KPSNPDVDHTLATIVAPSSLKSEGDEGEAEGAEEADTEDEGDSEDKK